MSALDQDPVAADIEVPVVTTEYGRVAGELTGHGYRFRGIPYAAAPVGPLRWRSPTPPEPWEGIRPATNYGPIAPQPTVEISGSQPPNMSEDCLSLNVFTPGLGHTALPVMVWIHGGAYYVGSSADTMFDGSLLAERGNVVVVTLNYRIGALGYLDFSGFASDEPFESNLGQRDQLAALTWVKHNIEAFGGDPGRVTLFGESAGAGAITTHFATPRARDLFAGAIAESSPVGSVYSPERGHRFAQRFLELIGIGEANVGVLRDLPIRTLTDACDQLVRFNARRDPGTIAVAPIVDGDLIPEYPLTAFQNGDTLRVPLVIGTNRNEAQLFKLMRSPILPTTPETIGRMLDGLRIPEAKQLPDAYPGYPSSASALHISTDAAFWMPTVWAATAHSALAPTWVYEFDFVRPLMRVLGLGSMHGSELPYVWGNSPATPLAKIPLGAAKAARRVENRIQARWLSFAHTLDPNPADEKLQWPRYDAHSRSTLMIDATDRIEDDPRREQRVAWGDGVIAFY